jgi:hypothetical protein
MAIYALSVNYGRNRFIKLTPGSIGSGNSICCTSDEISLITDDPGSNPARVQGFRTIWKWCCVYIIGCIFLACVMKIEIRTLAQNYLKRDLLKSSQVSEDGPCFGEWQVFCLFVRLVLGLRKEAASLEQ